VQTNGGTCDAYCTGQGRTCLRAQDNIIHTPCTIDDRHHRQTMESNGCDQKWGTQVCECSAPTETADVTTVTAPGQCSSAGSTVKSVTTDIKADVIPVLEAVSFNNSLAQTTALAVAANDTAWKMRKSADNYSTSLDKCRGTESQCQKALKYLEDEKTKFTTEKYAACDEQKRTSKVTYSMPESTHGPHKCDFAVHQETSEAPSKCWGREYQSALDKVEADLEAAEAEWNAAKESCSDWTKKVEAKGLEIIYKKEDCDKLKKGCNKIEAGKVTSYCALQDAISDLCEASDDLSGVWGLLKKQRKKKIAAIRTMNITVCMYKKYSLGDGNCKGCKFGSLSACEVSSDETFGVDIAEPPAVTAIAGVFDLPPTPEAASAWCKLEEAGSSAEISFPGHLWTRDASGTLSRSEAKEKTTLPQICTV